MFRVILIYLFSFIFFIGCKEEKSTNSPSTNQPPPSPDIVKPPQAVSKLSIVSRNPVAAIIRVHGVSSGDRVKLMGLMGTVFHLPVRVPALIILMILDKSIKLIFLSFQKGNFIKISNQIYKS